MTSPDPGGLPVRPGRVVLAAESGNGEAFFEFFKRHYPALRRSGLAGLEKAGSVWTITVPEDGLERVREALGFLPPHLEPESTTGE